MMPEHEMKITGGKAIVVLVALAGIIVFRVMTFSDQRGNESLMNQINVLLMSDYYPGEAEMMKAALKSGDDARIAEVVKSLTTTEVDVEELQTSSPLFNFDSNKKVIVKVVYALNDASGTRMRKTMYFQFSHGALLNSWQYQWESSAVSFFLNFL